MQKIIPHLWFNREAEEAITQYCKLLPNSQSQRISTIENTPSGDVSVFDFKLDGLDFQAINAGPFFKFNESISLFVTVNTAEKVDELYHRLVQDGSVLMPLDNYDFCPRYAWIADRYGLNWQLMVADDAHIVSPLRLGLLFSSTHCGQAEAAINAYATLFPNAQKGLISYYSEGEAVNPEAKVNYGELSIGGLDLVLMDHGYGGEADFNEAISLIILCDNQEEIDYYWSQLSHDPDAEQCGWLKDAFGVSWQIVPRNMGDYLVGPHDAVKRVTEAFLKMKKFDLSALEAAYKGV